LNRIEEILAKPGKKTTILLVEDETSLLEFFSTILRREGYEVITAGNGVEALEIAKEQPVDRIDVLFTDVAMPYMGGIQLAQSLREFQPDLRVLLTSGLPEDEVWDRCGPDLQVGFLPKPFLVADLSETMRSLVAAA